MARAGAARILAVGLLGLGLTVLAACATPASSDRMSIGAGDSAPPASGSMGDHAFRVGRVSGGAATSVIGLSEVSDDALRAALGASLRNLGYLADDQTKASLVIDTDLVGLDRPVAALDPVLIFVPIDLTVTVRIHYTVTRAAGGPPLFDDIVATTGTATASDAATPAGRVRKANEAAIRLNIVAFLQRFAARRGA